MSLLELHDISKFYGEGETAVACPLRDRSFGRRGPPRRGDGSLRLGEVNASHHRRKPRGADKCEVRIGGAALSRLSRNDKARLRRRSIGYVFQDFNLLPGLTAAENVALPLELDGVSARKAHPAGLAALERLGLADRAGTTPISSPAASASGWRSLAPWSVSAPPPGGRAVGSPRLDERRGRDGDDP